MRASRVVLVVSAVSLLAACAGTAPPAHKPVASVPPLDPKVSRVLVGAGMLNRGDAQGAPLMSVRQVGPVYVDGRWVGDLAEDAYIVVDLKPGAHEVGCSPLEPVRNYIEPRKVSFEAGETKSLVCDMTTRVGLAQKYSSKTYVEPRAISPAAAVVDYKKLP
jgi:hypothetical protein